MISNFDTTPGTPGYDLYWRFAKNLRYFEAKRGVSREQLLVHMNVYGDHFDRAVRMTSAERREYLEKMAAFLSVPLSALVAPVPNDYRTVVQSWRRG